MKKILLTLWRTSVIGFLSGFVFCVAKSVMILREAERLAEANPLNAGGIRCSAGSAATILPFLGIIVGGIFGLLMGGLLLLLYRLFHRERLP